MRDSQPSASTAIRALKANYRQLMAQEQANSHSGLLPFARRTKTTQVRPARPSAADAQFVAWRNRTWLQSCQRVFGVPYIYKSEDDKPPKGFEKFFKNRKNKDDKDTKEPSASSGKECKCFCP